MPSRSLRDSKVSPLHRGYKFKVVTDHSSLRWPCQMKNPTSRLARWALELQGHKFTVEHRKGALNHVADEKTFARVALRYYWPRYYAETQEYVRNCETCQRFKVEQRAPAGLMGRRVVDKP